MEFNKPQIKYVKVNDKYLCQIQNVTQQNNRQAQTQKECLIFVMDVSASMGKHINNAHAAFRNLVLSNKIENTLIATFGQRSTVSKYVGNKIQHWNCPQPENTTQLGTTIRSVFEHIIGTKDKTLFQIVIASDGEVHDLNQVLSYVENINTAQLNQHVIQVSSIRIGKEGDTRALTCFSVFHNHPTQEQQVIDIPSCPNNLALENELTNVFIHFSEGHNCYSNNITSSGNNLSRFPFDANLVNTLDINNNDYFICTQNNEIFIDGIKVEMVEQTNLNESDILSYLKLIEQKVRTVKVLGNDKFLVNIIPFLNSLQEVLKGSECLENKELSKMVQIKRNALKTQGSIINQILQLVNIDNVHKLNAQQQAQFLRQIDSSTQSGRRLAKRSNENTDDIGNILINGVKKILTGYHKIENENEDDDVPRSFFSISSSIEILNEAVDEIKDDLEMFSMEDILRCFGQIGLCFKAKIGNYPDPWQFKVQKVYNCYLGQHDIYEASIMANNDTEKCYLKVPGSQNIITGVDVIYYANNELYFKIRVVNKLHCSIAMRKIVADIPNDDIALKTAVIFQQIHQMMKEPLEKSIKDLWYNIQTLKFIINDKVNEIFGEEVVKALTLSNMDAYFTGDLNISSINKIIALLLVSNVKVDLPKLARSLLSLDCYHHIKSIEYIERDQAINNIFQINMDNRTIAKEPFEKEPDVVEFYDKYDSTHLMNVVKQYNNSYSKIINFVKFLGAYYNSNSLDELIKNVKLERNNNVFGIDVPIDLFVTANTIQAIQSPKLEYRVDVDKRLMLLEDISSNENIDKYFKSIVSNIFKVDYEKQLITKKFYEKERENAIQIELLTWECELDVFISKLNEFIPLRDNEKYQLLLKSFNENNDIPLLREKIWILCICKNIGDNPNPIPDERTESFVWNRGNVVSLTDLNSFKTMWNYDALSELKWDDMYDAWLKCARIHRYRESDIPNRHGHCNSNPYLGFK